MFQPFTANTLAKFAGRPVNDNMRSIILGLEVAGARAGLQAPHRLLHYIAQTGHESGLFRYDQELWGPTPAQKRYEGRKDLGNTAAGDGYRYRGRAGIQITGEANYAEFTKWALTLDPTAPDFVKTPDAVNTDPWEGLVPIWFWQSRRLNSYADTNNSEMLTRRINGGLNGYEDRLNNYTRLGLILLGYEPTDVRGFQRTNGLKVDGVAGPATRGQIHAKAHLLPPFDFRPQRQTVRYGHRGAAVAELQGLLASAGHDLGKADGIFGPKTEAALMKWQTSKGLEPTGVCDVVSWAVLLGE